AKVSKIGLDYNYFPLLEDGGCKKKRKQNNPIWLHNFQDFIIYNFFIPSKFWALHEKQRDATRVSLENPILDIFELNLQTNLYIFFLFYRTLIFTSLAMGGGI
ncbi:hypothetical protein ACJX0J_028803, partial [Zea mays]